MKIIEQYVFEVGDVFGGSGGGGYVFSCEGKTSMLFASDRYSIVCAVDSLANKITISGEGVCEQFLYENIVDHIKRGNMVYFGNFRRGGK